jgi:hypothetical protein
LQDNIERDHQKRRIILKEIIRKIWDAIVGSRKHAKGPSVPVNVGKFLDHPKDYRLFKKTDPWW